MFLLTCAVAGMVFAPEIVSFFRNEAEVVAVGAAALRWQMVSFVLLPTIGLTNMMMQTIRRPLEANFVAAARSGLFFIPLVLWLPRCWGLTGLEMCGQRRTFLRRLLLHRAPSLPHDATDGK